MVTAALLALLNVAGTSTGPSVVDHATRAYLSQVPEAPPPPPGVAVAPPGRSIFDLDHEYRQLERDKPGLGFPIAFIAVGGGLLILDALFLLSSYVLPYFFGSYALWPVFVVIGVAALAGFLGTGFLVLAIRLKQRSNYDRRMEELRVQMRAREGQHPYGLDRQDLPPPPPPPLPPPPPPTTHLSVPEPQFVLAEF